MSETHAKGLANNKPNVDDVIKSYVDKVDVDKKQMIDKLTKQQMANLIFKQNDIIAQQSSQMIELVDLVNRIETDSRNDEAQRCNAVRVGLSSCSKSEKEHTDKLSTYETSVRLQIVLFVLLALVLLWLVYHYASSCNSIA